MQEITCGRTPLFYALQYNDTRKAQYLIEKGANIGLKDNCNVSIFTLFIETCISKNVEKMDLFCSELFEEDQQRKALIYATLNHLYCQAPLLSLKSNAILYKKNVLGALAFVRKHCLVQDAHVVENIDKNIRRKRDVMYHVLYPCSSNWGLIPKLLIQMEIQLFILPLFCHFMGQRKTLSWIFVRNSRNLGRCTIQKITSISHLSSLACQICGKQ